MSDSADSQAQKLGAAAVQAGSFVLEASATAIRVVAEAASGRPLPAQAGEGALAGILRNGSTAVGSLVGLAVKAARDRIAPAPAPAQPSPPPSGAASGPMLRPGAMARIPLSIDNPGSEPMTDLVPRLSGATLDGAPHEPGFVVRFSPDRLTVAPRDFEKLVVTVQIAEDIAPGAWSLLFSLGKDGTNPHELPFQIAAAGADD